MGCCMKINEMSKIELSKWFEEYYPIKETGLSMRSSVQKVGINNCNYNVSIKINGKTKLCPCYSSWLDMLRRCYNKTFQIKHPTYAGVTVCDEWLLFTNFRMWWMNNYVEGWHLDKDLMIIGNKEYSSETCIYVPCMINNFIRDGNTNREKGGVWSWNKRKRKFTSTCRHPKTKVRESLGYFESANLAHNAWMNRKLEILRELKSEMDEIHPVLFSNINKIINERFNSLEIQEVS